MLSLRPALPSAPSLLRVLAMLAAAGGIGLWGATLFAPRPAAMPPALAPAAPRTPDNGPVALWFGKDEALRTQISVLGVIAGNDGAAVLSVDGGPPSAWRLGDEIAPGIALRGIEAGAVIVEQGGRSSRLPAPLMPPAPAAITPAR